MTVIDWAANATPVVDEDAPARSDCIDVTVLRKATVGTWDTVYRFLSWHRFSSGGETLWDHVVRTQVSSKVFLLLHVPSRREATIKDILRSNP